MPRYQNVIFDFDGTLVDSAPAILATFASVLHEAGISPAVPLDRSLIGPPLVPTLQKISASEDAGLIEKLASQFKAEYDEHKLPLTLAYPGIPQVLLDLRDSGVALYIATNKRERPTRRLLDLFGWHSLFDSVYCIDTPPNGFSGKTDMLSSLLREQCISNNSAVFVGDTESDGNAANSNGLAFLAVGWGYGNWNNVSAETKFDLIQDPAQVLEILSVQERPLRLRK